MAIVKASYTKNSKSAKASIRYIAHRRGKDGAKITRVLFGSDGIMGRADAYRMIDTAEKGSVFFRFIISPDPKEEDRNHDLRLRDVTTQTMQTLEERVHKPVFWVATEHNDHTPKRHVHVVAVVRERLNAHDFQSLRLAATQACVEQRTELDRERVKQEQAREEAEWEQEQ